MKILTTSFKRSHASTSNKMSDNSWSGERAKVLFIPRIKPVLEF